MNFLNVFLVGVFTMSLIPAEEAFACKGYQQWQYDRKRDQLVKLEDTHKKELAKCDGILRTVGKTLEDVNKCKLNRANLKRPQRIESLKRDIDSLKSKGCK